MRFWHCEEKDVEAFHLYPSLHRKEGIAMCSQPEPLVQGSWFGWLQDNRDSDLTREHCQVIMFKGVSGLKGCRVFVSEKWMGWKLNREVLSPCQEKTRKRSRNKDVCHIYGNKRIFIFRWIISKMKSGCSEEKAVWQTQPDKLLLLK